MFVSAAAGNLASYVNYQRSAAAGGEPAPPPGAGSAAAAGGWYYDVDKVGGSMGLFYGEATLQGASCQHIWWWECVRGRL